MTKNILLLGRTGFILEDVQHQLQTSNIQLFAGTGIENVRSAFAKARIDAPIHWYLASQERYPVTVVSTGSIILRVDGE